MWRLLPYLCALGAPVDSDRLRPYRGAPVAEVRMEAPEGEDPAVLLPLIDLGPGMLITQAEISRSIARLYALGRFSQVEAYAENSAEGVVLQFVVLPLVRISALEIDGLDIAQPGPLRAALNLQSGDELDSQTAPRAVAAARHNLHRQGFPSARVTADILPTDTAAQRILRLAVEEGPPRRLCGLHVSGAPRLPPALVRDLMPLRRGMVLGEAALESAQAALLSSYQSRGFLEASLAPPKLTQKNATCVQVEMGVQAGPRYTLRLRGQRIMTLPQAKALWPEFSGVPGRAALAIFEERLQAALAGLGWAQARAHARAQRAADGSVVRVDVALDEGPPVWVQAVDFPGVHALPLEVLRTQIRALLEKDLAGKNFVNRLWGHEAGAPPEGLNPAPAPPDAPPLARRWLPELYEDAAREIARAYHELGYLEVRVGTPEAVGERGAGAGDLCREAHKTDGLEPARACSISVRIPIEEGPQTFVAHIGFSGHFSQKPAALLDVVHNSATPGALAPPMAPGAPFSRTGAETGRIALERMLRDQGYLYARVGMDVVRTTGGLWAEVQYALEEGPQVRVQRVLVRGNRHTREGVVRSRIALRPGDIYRREISVKDRNSIGSLGVFSQVQVGLLDEEHVSPNKDVMVDLQERSRHSLELFPGISTSEGPRLRTVYAHNNVLGSASVFTAALKLNRQLFFNLLGAYADEMRGRYSGFRRGRQLTKGLERDAQIGLRSPPLRFLPFDPLVRLNLLHRRLNVLPYSLDSTSAVAGADMRLADGLRGSLEVQADLKHFDNVNTITEESVNLAYGRGGTQAGERWTLKMGPQLLFDRRDSLLSPSSGYFVSTRAAYGFGKFRDGKEVDPAADSFQFVKLEGNATAYLPLGGPVLAISLRAGNLFVGQNARKLIAPDERFYLGGRDSIRGFIEGQLVPQDACRSDAGRSDCYPVPVRANGLPISQGGNTFALAKVELRLPLRENLTFDLFADVGNLWENVWAIQPISRRALRIGTGAGLRYATPVGALAVDLGINPRPRRGYDANPVQLHISVGAF